MRRFKPLKNHSILCLIFFLMFCLAISYGQTPVTIERTISGSISLSMEKVSGDNQYGCSSSPLADEIVVKVVNKNGAGVAGATVEFAVSGKPSGATDGTLSFESVTTGSNGEARTSYTIGNKSGVYTISATAKDAEVQNGSTHSFSSTSVELARLDVVGATQIPNSTNYTVGQQSGVNAKVTLVLNPSIPVTDLPMNLISWTNGTAGSNQLERLVALDNPADLSIMAACGTTSSKSIRLIVRKSVMNMVTTPTDNVTITNPGPDNTFTPTIPTLDWEPVDGPNNSWVVHVKVLNCGGQLNIRPWPSQPTMMVVPNTANPVVGGNINNTAGSFNRWSYAITDLQNYDTMNGGAGPHWHNTAASVAHEYYHKDVDWFTSCFSSAGADWVQTETDLETLSVSALQHLTQADAQMALQTDVTSRLKTFTDALVDYWNNTIAPSDVPGGGGGGYAAGASVLAGDINAIDMFRISQGW